MADELPIPCVAYELQPGKLYLLEVDRAKVSDEQTSWLARTLEARGIQCVIVKSAGAGGVRLVPPPQEVPDAR